MAEIPTFQEIRQFDITPKGDDPSASRYLDRQEQLLKAGISLESDSQSVRLDTISRQVAFADGAGGLPTMKIGFVFRGTIDVSAGAHRLSYFDNNFPGRAGWKEVVVLDDGVTILSSSAPGTDRSLELTNYSSDVLNSPPQQLSALVVFRTSLSEPERSAAAAVIATSSNQHDPSGNKRGASGIRTSAARPPYVKNNARRRVRLPRCNYQRCNYFARPERRAVLPQRLRSIHRCSAATRGPRADYAAQSLYRVDFDAG